MPARLTVTLERLDGRLPEQHGPALRAGVLGAVRRVDPCLSAWMHRTGGGPDRQRPYALTPIHSVGGDPVFVVRLVAPDDARASPPDGPAGWSCLELARVVSGAVSALDGSGPDRCLRVGGGLFAVASIAAEVVPYAHLLVADDRREWTLRLRSPTTRRIASPDAGRRTLLLPSSEVVFQVLARRWERGGGPPLRGAATAGSAVEVVEVDLRSVPYLVKGPDVFLAGCVGSVTYRAVAGPADDSAGSAAVSALVRFAAFAGVGDETPVGMGWVEPV